MTITESTDKTGDDMSFFDRWSKREDEELLALAINTTPYNRELGRFDPDAAEHIAPLWIAIRETPRWRNAINPTQLQTYRRRRTQRRTL